MFLKKMSTEKSNSLKKNLKNWFRPMNLTKIPTRAQKACFKHSRNNSF